MSIIAEHILTGTADTDKFAVEIKNLVKPGDVFALHGNLGSGKTYLVKKIAELLGADNTSSPSFAIVNEYIGSIKIFHFDFYRIKKITELYDIGFEEYLSREAVIFIEWADMFPDIIPSDCYKINIELLNNDERKITLIKDE
jgi:tRNA threonylcarbamoyladenosine biosynthesis protein TsaE